MATPESPHNFYNSPYTVSQESFHILSSAIEKVRERDAHFRVLGFLYDEKQIPQKNILIKQNPQVTIFINNGKYLQLIHTLVSETMHAIACEHTSAFIEQREPLNDFVLIDVEMTNILDKHFPVSENSI